jgi:hypothetical protein
VKNIAQNVCSPIHFIKIIAEPLTQKCGLGTSAIFKKVNNHPLGENSPNLVTLVGRTQISLGQKPK